MKQLFKPHYHIDECLSKIRECMEIGWTGLGNFTTVFENDWIEYTKLPYAHFLNSATAGLHLAVKILKMENGWSKGDEIISSSITFISTNHAISYENLTVIFADVDEYLCLNPSDVEKKITARTKAIMFVGYGGNIGRYYEIVELCKKYNLKLIFDAAHCAGTRYNGQIPGKEADMVVYSFQAVKNLPTCDSGMLCCRTKQQDELARKLSWLGINKTTDERTNSSGAYKWKYNVEYTGYKYHGNSLIAAIAIVQLKYLDQDNAYRRQLAEWYTFNFKEYRDVIKIIPIIEHCESSRHLYVIEVADRDEIMLGLNQTHIGPGVHYTSNTEYPMYSYAKGSVPNAEKMDDKIISLPMHLELTKADIDGISHKVINLVTKNDI